MEFIFQVKEYKLYDKVWENISKYAKVQPAPDRVKTKFIFIPNINTSKKEIEEWVEKSISVGVKHLALDIEMLWYERNKNNLPSEILNLFEYTVKLIREKELGVDFIDRGIIISEKLKLENRI